jgi:predicted O-linked N-acetylglucosamine transferase (SPINDLY family)
VGFISPDLREHSVSYFLEPILAHLDPEQFEVVLYHDHYRVDACSERLKAHAILWRNFVGQSHAAVAAQIRADHLDILIDLAGHTGLNRLPVFAARVAPVQMTYLGYPDTTGIRAMDYRLVDALTDPAGDADRFSSERLLRFSSTLWSYRPPQDAPSVALARSGPPVFGSSNNLSKVSDETLRGWAGVLHSVPESRLRLKADGLQHAAVAGQLLQRAGAAGIDAARIQLVPRAATVAEHLAFYHEIDVALDTFPYHGTTTTCEALWMGVPVVSLVGDRHCARVGASLLSAIGRPEWAAADWNGYVQAAARCARERPNRSAVRAALASSALMDHAGQAARFGGALRQGWLERAESSAAVAA